MREEEERPCETEREEEKNNKNGGRRAEHRQPDTEAAGRYVLITRVYTCVYVEGDATGVQLYIEMWLREVGWVRSPIEREQPSAVSRATGSPRLPTFALSLSFYPRPDYA